MSGIKQCSTEGCAWMRRRCIRGRARLLLDARGRRATLERAAAGAVRCAALAAAAGAAAGQLPGARPAHRRSHGVFRRCTDKPVFECSRGIGKGCLGVLAGAASGRPVPAAAGARNAGPAQGQGVHVLLFVTLAAAAEALIWSAVRIQRRLCPVAVHHHDTVYVQHQQPMAQLYACCAAGCMGRSTYNSRSD